LTISILKLSIALGLIIYVYILVVLSYLVGLTLLSIYDYVLDLAVFCFKFYSMFLYNGKVPILSLMLSLDIVLVVKSPNVISLLSSLIE
jgi:hypothetical protein